MRNGSTRRCARQEKACKMNTSSLGDTFQEINRLKALRDEILLEEAGLQAKLRAVEEINKAKKKEIANAEKHCDDLDEKISGLGHQDRSLGATIQHLHDTRQ